MDPSITKKKKKKKSKDKDKEKEEAYKVKIFIIWWLYVGGFFSLWCYDIFSGEGKF